MLDDIHCAVVKTLVKPAVGVNGDWLVLVLADVDSAVDRLEILKEVLYAHFIIIEAARSNKNKLMQERSIRRRTRISEKLLISLLLRVPLFSLFPFTETRRSSLLLHITYTLPSWSRGSS